MKNIQQGIIALLALCYSLGAYAQNTFTGSITDKSTGEPLIGAEILIVNTTQGTITNTLGAFSLSSAEENPTLQISYVGYKPLQLTAKELLTSPAIGLEPATNALEQVVVSANRERELRSEVPAAISTLSLTTIEETAPNTLDQVLNKVPGVFVADLANEQHMTAIRQPISSKGLFLYLEDGLPTRPTGVFNHNAMNELNQAAISSIEVIRGPASSTYGAEAIGGVINVITKKPTLAPTAQAAIRTNSNGLYRADASASTTQGNTGFLVAGYSAIRRNGYFEHSDMNKYGATLKVTQVLSPKTDLNASLTYAYLLTDMTGSLDSAAFYGGDVTSQQTFTNREVSALRAQATLHHDWTPNANTTARIFGRVNRLGQIPSYRIRTDRTTGSSSGTINERSFESIGTLLQHAQKLPQLNAQLIAGLSIDHSPTDYFEEYISVDRDENGTYTSYEQPDSLLTNNSIVLTNLGSYATLKLSPLEKLQLSASLRYDRFQYLHTNHLEPSAFSGSPDARSTFQAITPKIGVTLTLSPSKGMYANYAQGFVPPQVGELYNGVKVPTLDPSIYHSYEVGGWYAAQLSDQLRANLSLSLYQMSATNQIISVQLDDGTYQNRNAGETSSRGIEYQLQASHKAGVSFRWSGAFARHEFVTFVENGNDYSGNEMPHGANVQYNWEVSYKPSFVPNLGVSLENQHLGPYWMNSDNTRQYDGFSLWNVRARYQLGGFQLSAAILNLSDELWSPRASASSWGTTYTLGIPRTWQLSIGYQFKSTN
ncbi:TonB-dependent receptor [Marinoscillum furvescens]|uniref:Outer membrane receptor protein involved in Fe transport n=1 Tax=Marinoscillum furvescens DSM 4134 TaxID=1122208 RepID=A0A3D9L487_MARFU|nr:TonB-dependent receptor [Marinoscillum furvescens]RED98430.1 outer membrane receptor protein involved in Fe transport [Marinoscillum furvescens DSM 4134]